MVTKFAVEPHTFANNLIEKTDDRLNLYIIFIEFNDLETSTIISHLRANQFAPRGHNVESLEELLTTVALRSWDLIICKSQQSIFNPYEMAQKLLSLEKDIPVLQLVNKPGQQETTEGLLNNIQAVLPSDNIDLLLLHIQREISHLQTRRSARSLYSQLTESQKRCQSLMDHSALAICFINNQTIVYVNDAFAQLLGYQVKEVLLNKPVFQLLASQENDGLSNLISQFKDSGQNQQPYQVLAKRADKSHFAAHIELKHAHYNDQDCIEITMDQQKKRKDEETFAKLDAITGLYNARFFDNFLENQIRQAHQGGNDSHLIYIEILNFSSTKSELGNQAGRSFARDIADIINSEFYKTHTKARLEDGVFCILYLEPSSDASIEKARRLAKRLQSHITQYEQHQIPLDAAIGLVPLTDTAPNVEQIYNRAKIAATQASTIADNELKITLFTLDNKAIDNELRSVKQAKEAIENDKLLLLYQPLIPLVFNSEQQHYEVLLRMIDDNNQVISPQQFLTSVGHANLDQEMDKWVIERSIDRFQLERTNNKALKLFISVTDTVWEKQGLLVWLAQSLRNSRIEADNIVFQISETQAATKLNEAKFFVDGLRQLNCLICLKHYGSTNRSQEIVKILNPDYVKLDGSYITELAENNALNDEFKSLLSTLKNLGKITIAPQVETPRVMSLLWKSKVCMIQGYYLQAPQPEIEYEF
ncbi:EAL domain-containing protein [Gammaproteobacteria bacterium AS21]|jgi:diguanylate cyclase (GGDEF)-like protein/PAS domain S-box-containing protein